MPQMPTLPNATSKPIPCLKNRDFDAMLQQNIGTSQPSKPSTDNAHMDHLRRFRHGAFEHIFGMYVLVASVDFPRV
jgi:hypothetical protein